MKRFCLFLALGLLPFLAACGGGGGGGLFDPAPGIDPFAYTLTTFTPATTPTLPTPDFRVFSINSGFPSYAGTGNGLYTFTLPLSGAPVFTPVTDAGLTNGSITCLLQEPSGSLLIGTENGLFRRPAAGSPISALASLAGRKIRCLYIATDNKLWVGLEDPTAAAVAAFSADSGNTFTLVGSATPYNLTASAVVSIGQTSAGKVMVCGNGGRGGLFGYSEISGFTLQDTPVATGATLFFTIGTAMHVGGPARGLWVFNTTTQAWDQVKEVASDSTPQCVTQAPATANTLGPITWVGTDKGIYYKKPQYSAQWYPLSTTNTGLKNNDCRSIADINNPWIAHPGATGGFSRAMYVP